MDMNQRYEAMALIEKITDMKSEFFNAADAKRLVELVPAKIQPFRFRIRGRSSGKSGQSEGYSPGIGNVSVPDDKKDKKFDYDTGTTWRIGGYKVMHTPGAMVISHMWADTKDDETGMHCCLAYNKASGAPTALQSSVQKTLRLGPIMLGYMSWTDWKTPSDEPAPAV